MSVVSVLLFALTATVRTHLAATDVCVIMGSSYRVTPAQVQCHVTKVGAEAITDFQTV